ncbi:MAG: cyclase [Thermoplasmata archaeon]|nr:MAG: cyclase [Thermoplasmata archaeon]
MAYLLSIQKVEDYEKWKKVYDDEERQADRRKNGSKGGYVYRNPSDPNEVVVLLEWDDADRANKYVDSQKLKQAMGRAGLVGHQKCTC